jgi:hypothetical protein
VRAALTDSHDLLALFVVHSAFVVSRHRGDLAVSVMVIFVELQLFS